MYRYYNSVSNWIINCRYPLSKNAAISLILCFYILSSMLIPTPAGATAYPIPDNGGRLIGSHELYKVRAGDYFHSIARFYNIGLIALMESNPGVDPFLPPIGTKLQIPIRMLLPDVPYRGIVINLPEFRLYYFPKGTNKVHVFPVGIGRADRPTPVMQSRIMSKVKKPSWTPNARIRADHLAKYGKELPLIVPPGEDNPLGDYALQLAFGHNNYWIHGTNQNFGIGMRVSAGCVRMNPVDIAWLFEQVTVNEEVRIINQPIKISAEPDGENILEVHSPLSTRKGESEYDLNKLDEIVKFNKQDEINNHAVKRALLLHQGIPVNVDS